MSEYQRHFLAVSPSLEYRWLESRVMVAVWSLIVAPALSLFGPSSLISRSGVGPHCPRVRPALLTATMEEVSKEVSKEERKAVIQAHLELHEEIGRAEDNGEVLRLYFLEQNYEGTNAASSVAAALHRLAVINKRRRAGRDALLRDRRFEELVDAVIEHAAEMNARSVADVLWSCATLQHWPATLLKPILTAVVRHLGTGAFEGKHLSTMVWSLARLQCKPVRLLEQMEEQAIPQLPKMEMQNCANLLWGFANLNYPPSKLLPELSTTLLTPGMLSSAKPVEVADCAAALKLIAGPGEHIELLSGLAEQAAGGCLPRYTSRQLVVLLSAFTHLRAIEALLEGQLDAWVDAVRAAHEATPLLAHDSKSLEASLESLGLDASWISRSEMLNTWTDMAAGRRGGKMSTFSDEDLRAAFDAIDTDKSGDIDQSELLAAIMAINPDASEADVKKMLVLADEDGDLQAAH